MFCNDSIMANFLYAKSFTNSCGNPRNTMATMGWHTGSKSVGQCQHVIFNLLPSRDHLTGCVVTLRILHELGLE